jgi:putative hemolysin
LEPDSLWKLVILILLLGLIAFFSAAEIALMSLSKIRIRHMVEAKVKKADSIDKLTQNPNRFLSAILIGNTVSNTLISSLATVIVTDKFGNKGSAIAISTAIISFLILIFGELIPKSLGAQKSEQVSLKLAGVVTIIVTILSPLVWIFTRITALFIGSTTISSKLITEEELKTIVDVSEEEGVLEVEEKQMIYNVFKFGDRQIKDIMIPRTDVIAMDVESEYKEVIYVTEKNQYSRVPVYRENVDNIIGILNLKDLVVIKDENKQHFNLENIIREAYYTYEFKKISELFTDMKKKRAHMSIVLDEYGGTSGIVTMEDIIEEIVGDIEDEYDEVENEIEVVKEDEYIVEGSTKIEEVNEMIGTSFESEDFDSIAGFIIGTVGRIPDKGEVVEHENVKFVVEDIENNRIKKVRIFT